MDFDLLDHFPQIACGSAVILVVILAFLCHCSFDVAKDFFRDYVLSVAAAQLFTKGSGKSHQREQAEMAAMIIRLLRR